MPIYEERYRTWQGTLRRRPLTWWVIARTGVPLQWGKLMKVLVILAAIPIMVRAIQVYAFMRAGDAPQMAEFITGLSINGKFFLDLLRQQNLWLVFALVLSGAGLIADDRRLGAYPIYFARPVGFGDYVGGKLLVTGTFGGAITLLPALLLWLMAVLLSRDGAFFSDWWWIPFAAVGQSLLMIGVYGSVVLALSASSKAARPAAVLFFAVYFLPELFRQVAPSGSDSAIGLISLPVNLKQTGALLFGEPPPMGFSPWLSLSVLVLVMVIALAVILYRVRPSEVVR